MKKSKHPFTGKLVYVALIGDKRYNLTVHRPHWEKHGGRHFLVGTVPPGGSSRDWSVGAVAGIAWDQVTDYMVFDSIEDYHEHLSAFSRKKRVA